jgi:RNA 3'-terminal phosphate cyclase (ATP)
MNQAKWIEIDGSFGEGGGQIVRSCLALSMVTGNPVAITQIRAGRQKPGLKKQHVTCVQAASEICNAQVQGNHLGSSFLSFEPGTPIGGSYRFRIGSAGSTSLVLQTVLPALMIANETTTVEIEGGTHNDLAPPYHFLANSFLPLLRRLGPKVTLTLKDYGFFPVGQGRIHAVIEPATQLCPYDLMERGELMRRRVVALVAGLPNHIAEREADVVRRGLSLSLNDVRCESVAAACPGNYLYIELKSHHVSETISGFGRIHVPAERVARDALRQAKAYLACSAPVGEYLADQWMLPLAIAVWQRQQQGIPCPARFRTVPLSLHTQTHIELLRTFLGLRIETENLPDGSCVLALDCDDRRREQVGFDGV